MLELSQVKRITDVLQEITEELILLDPSGKNDFKNLLELVAQLEEKLPTDQHKDLLDHLEQLISGGEQYNIDEEMKAFQKSVDSLLSTYSGVDPSDKIIEASGASENPPYFDDPDLLQDFLVEGEEHLEAVENNLIELEQSPGNSELIDAVFRPFHTIKGVAGFLNIEDIQQLSHNFEDYLDLVRSGEAELTSEATSVILEGVDGLRAIFDAIRNGLETGSYTPHTVTVAQLIEKVKSLQSDESATDDGEAAIAPEMEQGADAADTADPSAPEDTSDNSNESEGFDGMDPLQDPSLVRDFIQEAEDHLSSVEQNLIQWENDPENLKIVDDIFRPFHTIKGVAGFLNLTDINQLAHEYENLLDQAREGEITLSHSMTDLILAGVDAFREMMDILAESLNEGELLPHSVDVDEFVARIEGFQNGDTDVVPKSEPKSTAEKANTPKSKPAQETGSQGSTGSMSAARQKIVSSIKVDTEKMDFLIDMVGELVITQNMIAQNPVVRDATDKRLLGDMGQFKRITSTLQDIAMSLRMVPIEATFRKMQRIVRDLAHKSGKRINLTLSGEQTEIDRNMVEALYDPLVHMVRNACDHGIEHPDQRVKNGKSETGNLHLNAYHKGGNIVIEIADDGAGLNKDAILKKAIDRGVIDSDQDLTDKKIYELVMQPGFSTAKQVTDVSGRGVGMDVVKRTLERMRGQIEIESEAGKGTTFYIKLPLTLAIIDGVIIRVGSERFVIPTLNIEESVQPKQSDYNFIAGQGETIKIRDHIFPLIRLHHLFDVPGAIQNPWDGIIILAKVGNDLAGLLVDELVDKQEVVIKSMGDQLQSLPGISGGAILGDGTVGLILDVPTLLTVRDAKNRAGKFQRDARKKRIEAILDSEGAPSANGESQKNDDMNDKEALDG